MSFGRSGSPSWPSTSINATVHCRPFGSVTTSRSTYFESSRDHIALGIGDWGLGIGDWGLGIRDWGLRSRDQLRERARDLGAGERLRDQQHVLGLASAQARVGFLRRIADDHDRQRRMIRVAAQ